MTSQKQSYSATKINTSDIYYRNYGFILLFSFIHLFFIVEIHLSVVKTDRKIKIEKCSTDIFC